MAQKIPVTVITGFLGSGKTSLIRHLLQNNAGRRIAVLVNEFGELGIDGDLLKSCQVCPEDEDGGSNIFELTNGCLCCTVQEEFLPTMQELLKRRDSIDCIVIETSGLALPKPLVKAFRWQEIRNAATVDAVVTVVDCAAVASGTFASDLEAIAIQRQADDSLEHETPLQELFEDQLACADLVVLSKTDLVDAETKSQVEELVKQELPRVVKMVESDRGQLDPSILLGFQAAVEDNLDSRPSHHDTEEDHDHDDDITSTHLILDRDFDPEKLQQQLQTLTNQQEIYRIKGFVAVPNKPMRLVMQGVGNRFDKFYDRPWQPQEARQTRLVFIGRDLNSTEIESQLVAL
ncbi:Cobalamin synthesis protein/P47K [Trichormus variabilis ATCC 29413]|uniref:Cobalamin synthesis protein/P47K n=2 Tax=Anabaena variabilis TaxID=264691 RepID=Q3M7M2_TRIV2|nr:MULTISPECIES: cobalamin biosynthesis protein CobW [Nostocaceae]ABA23014.1 Cobalamin synthesis protein/P47K [Trichormus variabilis ATCC 29413]MBC1215302.1 cobalamin biosynthesis protein CobW [Trichormus variabilis ARAD]MBC1256356.1 cobalamin biosynthesis protein CobW [Trichormus variabilis V5]MBC1268892.1 cobalamin biosynthesis protein CobW [Trichormus variabilis FSR]MBC1303967.1 cobalamin biosynthesis protein CobW [Trichormus variabilis N2B]